MLKIPNGAAQVMSCPHIHRFVAIGSLIKEGIIVMIKASHSSHREEVTISSNHFKLG